MGPLQYIRMLGMLRYESSFAQIENRKSLRVGILDAESKKAGQVKNKEKGIIRQHPSLAHIQVDKRVFDKIKKIGIGLRLFDTLLQQLHHKEGNGVLQYIKENMLIQGTPLEFPDPLQVL